MDLSPHVDRLAAEVASLVDVGEPDSQGLLDRIVGALDSAIRLTLLEALSAAADEIGRELAPGSVELRLRGRDPQFVVTAAEPLEVAAPADRGAPVDLRAPAGSAVPSDDGTATRINLRLSEALKAAVEEAAAREGRSVNAWLVQAASAALRPGRQEQQPGQPARPGPQRYTGWVH